VVIALDSIPHRILIRNKALERTKSSGFSTDRRDKRHLWLSVLGGSWWIDRKGKKVAPLGGYFLAVSGFIFSSFLHPSHEGGLLVAACGLGRALLDGFSCQ
jgi:hypothetical protein